MNQPVAVRLDSESAVERAIALSASGDFETCHEALARICKPYRLEASHWRDFKGSIRNFRAAALNVTELLLPDSRIVRDPNADAHLTGPYFSLVMQVSGAARIAHHGCAVELNAGECTLLDSRHPTVVEVSRGTRQYSFNFFRSSALEQLAMDSRIICRRIPCSQGPGMVMVDSLRSVVRNAECLGTVDLRDWALELLQAVLGRPLTASAARTLDIGVLIRYVDSRLHVPSLSPQCLASHFNVSLRQLYRVTASSDLTPAALIWERRLRRARSLLSNGSELSVTQVAYQCGFKDGGHFSRSYRRAFGESPSESRELLVHNT